MKYVIVFDKDRCYEKLCNSDLNFHGLAVKQIESEVFVNEVLLSSDTIFHIDKFSVFLFDSDEKTIYERKKQMFFGEGGDVEFLEGNITFVVEGNKLFKSENQIIYKNGKRMKDESFENGDIFQLGSVRIVFYEKQLEVFSKQRRYRTVLLECEEELSFPNFPYYKKSPRIHKRIKEETIEILSPPHQQTLESKNIALMFLPTLLMGSVSVAVGVLRGQGIYLLISIFSTLISFSTGLIKYIGDKRKYKNSNLERIEIYEKYLKDIRKIVYTTYQDCMEILQYNNLNCREIEEK